jgi:hypothetical protein
MYIGRSMGATSGRRRFQHVAEAGYARVTMDAIIDGAVEQRRGSRAAQQRPGDSSGR